MTHFTSSLAGGTAAPLGGAVGNSDAARSLAMAATIFDWALHPWAQFTSFVAIGLILIFFVTGWDSGTLVIDTMTAGGRTDTLLRQKTIWLVAVGGIGIVLLLSGGLTSLQAGAIATGLPLALILLGMCIGTLKGLLVLHRNPDGREQL